MGDSFGQSTEAEWFDEEKARDSLYFVKKWTNEYGSDPARIPLQDILEMSIQLRAALTIIEEWGISKEPPIKITQKEITPMNVKGGDSIEIKFTPLDGPEQELKANIGKEMVVDSLAIYSFKDALGHTNSVCGIFGSKKKYHIINNL